MQSEQMNRVDHTLRVLAFARDEMIKVKCELSHETVTVERQKEIIKAISKANDSIKTARLLIELLDQ